MGTAAGGDTGNTVGVLGPAVFMSTTRTMGGAPMIVIGTAVFAIATAVSTGGTAAAAIV
jgi:hypothetical protein